MSYSVLKKLSMHRVDVVIAGQLLNPRRKDYRHNLQSHDHEKHCHSEENSLYFPVPREQINNLSCYISLYSCPPLLCATLVSIFSPPIPAILQSLFPTSHLLEPEFSILAVCTPYTILTHCGKLFASHTWDAASFKSLMIHSL